MDLARQEIVACRQLLERDGLLRKFLAANSLVEPIEMKTWFQYLVGIKDVLGNVNNSASLLATILSKQFLCILVVIGRAA